MKRLLALLILVLAVSQASAQAGRSEGADARTDALLGTPNKATPVPQTNRFSTSPGLEQQAPGPYGKDWPRDSGTTNPPAGSKP